MTTSDLGIVHVDLDRLDRLLNLVGELVITRTTFVDQARRARAKFGFKEQVLNLLENTERVGRIGEEIQSKIIKARLVPVDTVFGRFAGVVEAFSQKSDKEIVLEISGGRTEVDKRTIDELAEPLVHLVRNALDHGIEPATERQRAGKPAAGTIVLEARHEGNRLVVEVRDDGGGVDLEAVKAKALRRGLISEEDSERIDERSLLQLLFHPGFSTSGNVTDMSGRGVGLDAAKRRVEMLGGRIEISSVMGRGSQARIDLPLTTAIVEALMVGIADESYALPLEHVSEIVRTRRDQISTVEGREVIDLRGEALSLIYLADLTELTGVEDGNREMQVVVVRHGDQLIGLAVDEILERHQIVIKGMGRRLAGIHGIAGASIGGDGNVVMVLDVVALCNEAVAAN